MMTIFRLAGKIWRI